ncbi:hypothetical protein AU197_07465 [Mycobacterium sp. IS-1590]|uniref:hypothetical protein n=1 Tax=Mycobacterium sp. IS-1590 TaxID=1772286 RepID=UPI000749A4C7|nr:hypothetical protein [Mycobacterium sp. IS-1590]KUI34500.1 hypothetical protein AU197_07465 [Mycobacterium sp. IS-1590]
MLRIVLAAMLIALISAPVACAEPAPPPGPPPQTGRCTADLEGARTQSSGTDTVSVCRGGAWQDVTGPQPPADRWVSQAAPLKLHGQGMRNPDMAAGKWVGTPQDSSTTCRAQQQVVVSPGELSTPTIVEGKPGQPLQFDIPPRMFLIELSGDCLWARS